MKQQLVGNEAASAAAETMHAARLLMVRVRPGCCAGLPLGSVAEVTRPLPIEGVAGAPAFVKGVAVIRAAPVPVIDLAAVLGIEPPARLSRFVVLNVGQRHVAVAVESVIGFASLHDEPLRQTPPLLQDAPGERVDAIGALDGELLLVLRVGRLIPDDLCADLADQAGAT